MSSELKIEGYTVSVSQSVDGFPQWVQIDMRTKDKEFRMLVHPDKAKVFGDWLNSMMTNVVRVDL